MSTEYHQPQALAVNGPDEHQKHNNGQVNNRNGGPQLKEMDFTFTFRFDSSKFCSYCKQNGHDISECLMKKYMELQSPQDLVRRRNNGTTFATATEEEQSPK